MSHLQHNKKILNRIKRLQGQLNAVETTVIEGKSSCMDILQQVAAIKGAITGLTNELIEEQLTQHVLPADYNAQELEKFLGLLKKYN
ncbi:metal-sensitive transcriptional repressor [Pelistega indica]|uniref:Metal-sensitive transcriptional repressor n=1 Tax=Pelistega indica TaxID=1414851 RepID=V8G1P9_9BURK|nr:MULTISPECIES: metal/formaldehyde-sensitive transcriptional repressor [Pelistega]ETD69612.1 metal-sensitive transcriptional repressor [Pelistega indica]